MAALYGEVDDDVVVVGDHGADLLAEAFEGQVGAFDAGAQLGQAADHAVGRAVGDEVFREIVGQTVQAAFVPDLAIDGEAEGSVGVGLRGGGHGAAPWVECSMAAGGVAGKRPVFRVAGRGTHMGLSGADAPPLGGLVRRALEEAQAPSVPALPGHLSQRSHEGGGNEGVEASGSGVALGQGGGMSERAYHLTEIREHLKAEIVARVWAGEELTALCREAGMPSHPSLARWRRADWRFGLALMEAMKRGREVRRFAFDEEKAAEVLRRLRAGETIGTITNARGATVDRPVYLRWMGTQASFQAEVKRVSDQNRKLSIDATRPGRWAFDAVLADRLVAAVAAGGTMGALRGRDGFPCAKVLDRWRRAQPEFDQALRTAIRVRARRAGAEAAGGEAAAEPILDLVRRGMTLNQVSRQPGMPTATTLYRRMRLYPAFRDAVARARAEQADWLGDRLWELTKHGRPAPADRQEAANIKRRLRRLGAAFPNGV